MASCLVSGCWNLSLNSTLFVPYLILSFVVPNEEVNAVVFVACSHLGVALSPVLCGEWCFVECDDRDVAGALILSGGVSTIICH